MSERRKMAMKAHHASFDRARDRCTRRRGTEEGLLRFACLKRLLRSSEEP